LADPFGKNKLFVFGDYQGQRATLAGTSQTVYPPPSKEETSTAGTGADLSDLGKEHHDPCTDKVNGLYASLHVAPANRAQFARQRDTGKSLVCAGCRFAQQDPTCQVLRAPHPFSNNFSPPGNNTLDSNGFDVRSDFVATNK